MKITNSIIGPRNAQIFSLNNAQILIWPPDYYFDYISIEEHTLLSEMTLVLNKTDLHEAHKSIFLVVNHSSNN